MANMSAVVSAWILREGARNSLFYRSFSSRAVRGASNPSPSKASGTWLVNEKLISALCSKHRSSPESLQVRLILKLDGSEATTNQVTSLSDAIQLSLKHEKDLIGIAVNQEVPVLKVDSLQRLAYEAKKTQNKNRMGSLPEKEFRFNTWIAENDFQRKMDGVLQSLSRGHSCMISIVAGSKSKVPDAARAMATSIIERAWQAGESTNQLKGSSNNRVVQFRLRPTSGARRNKE